MPIADSTQSHRDAPPVLKWQCWPLRDRYPYSLGVFLSMVLVGVGIGFLAASRAIAVVGTAALLLSMGSYFVPTVYEIHPRGFGRRLARVSGSPRIVRWSAVQSFQPRATGIVLFRRTDPHPAEIFRSEFIPYGDDADEVLCAARYYLEHAEELPNR